MNCWVEYGSYIVYKTINPVRDLFSSLYFAESDSHFAEVATLLPEVSGFYPEVDSF